MRTGRYSYNAQQRSILRPIKKVQKLAEGFEGNYDCAIINERHGYGQTSSQACDQLEKTDANETKIENENSSVIASSSLMEITTKQEFLVAFYRACNTIFAQHGTPRLINVSFVWPTDSEEALTAELTRYLADLCKKEEVELGSVTASVSSFVQKGFVTISAVGFVNQADTDSKLNAEKNQSAKKNQNAEKEKKKTLAGSTLCIAGHAGLAGIGLLASAGEEALKRQYTQGFIRQAQKFLDDFSLRPVKEALEGIQTTIYPVQEGGVLTALWNFADGARVGLDIDMKKIPIRQESVEISEFYSINPYQLLGDGACLIATREPEKVCAALAQAGIKSQAIGQVTDQNAKIIRRDDEVRYLDKPAQDEFERRKSEQSHEASQN